MKRKSFLLILLALLAFGPTAWAQWSGSGTQNEPYQIASTDDWNTLATNVNAGTTYSGKYFKLMDNISVNTMVGTSNNLFKGTFDGNGKSVTFSISVSQQYAAPFRYIENATIKNLKIAGEVTMTSTSSQRFVGGVVAYAKGTSYITNCINSTTINSSVNGDTGNGGIAGMVGGGGTIYITGCVFNGKMIGSNAYNWAGVIALVNGNCTAYISDCLFVPSEDSVNTTKDNFTVCRIGGSANDNNLGKATISNCYYTETMNKVQSNSARAYTITGETCITVAMNGEANSIYDVSGLSFYSPGLTFNDGSATTVYASEGDYVNLSLTVPLGYEITAATYTPEGGPETTINPANNVYSFTMPNANVTINAETAYYVNYWVGDGTRDKPFQIATTDDFDMLSTLVRNMPSDHPFYYGDNLIFYGYYFILINDLDYTGKTFTPVGYFNSNDNKRGFRGTLDGQGHVIKGISYEGTSGGAGIFGLATGDIKNLALVNSTIKCGNHTGGIVGYFNGGTISNCHVANNVCIDTPTTDIVAYHGGIVGRKYTGTISYCTSAATIKNHTTSYGNYFGGIAGSNANNGDINHCLFTGDIVSYGTTTNYRGPIAGSNPGTITNCYWTNSSFEGSSPSTDNDNSGFINTINDLQDMMIVSTYSDDFTALAPNIYMLQKTISEWSTNPVGGWYLIASPVVGDIAPDAVMNLLGTQIPNSSLYNFDLYRFNQSPDMINGEYKEWENYHQHNETEEPFLLENGKGYLYARSEETTLTFTGTFNTSTEPVDVTLTYETTNPKAIMHGWNLVGNPFPVTAYVNRPFYKMNDAGTGIVPVVNDFNSYTPTTIPTCTGIMVQTTADEVTQGTNKVTFSTTVPTQQATNNGNLQIALSQSNTRGNALLDNAIVSFNEGSKLGKFYFGEQNANIYIPQNAEEYAIAYSNKQGEMPLNFKASMNGEYSLSINPEGVEMSYLHLIDNMTGADIDLLQNPSYSFNATTTDYESRFKLVFSANNNGDDASTGSATFAFYSNGNWVIANEGEATLQVVDLMGRILSSETVNGSVSKAINTVPGVYMIRLINGENVKVQKVVIE